jgi:hypothetical protein
MKALSWWTDFMRESFGDLGIGALPLPLTEPRWFKTSAFKTDT